MEAPSKSTLSRLPAILALAVVVGRVVQLRVLDITWEDALISLRYAENLASGHGFAYNPGERVLGTTTPLYTLWLALLQVFGGPAMRTLWKLANALFDGGAIYWLSRLMIDRRRLSVAAGCLALFMILSPTLTNVSLAGMETALLMMLMGLLLWLVDTQRPAWAGVVAALLVLTRPDGALLGSIAAAAVAIRQPRQLLRFTPAFAAVLGPSLLIEIAYFGSPVPQSLVAKLTEFNYPLREMLAEVGGWYWGLGPVINGLAGIGMAFVITEETSLWPLLAFEVLYPLSIVGSRLYLFEWYLAPGFIAHYMMAALGAQGITHQLADQRHKTTAFAGAVALSMASLVPRAITNLRWQRALQTYESGVRGAIGQWLNHNTAASSTVMLEPIGYIGYYSHRYILDAAGLTSVAMADARRVHPEDWLFHMLEWYQPDYLIARDAFAEPGLRLSPSERASIEAGYHVVQRFPSTDPSLQSMVILERTPRAKRADQTISSASSPSPHP